MHTTRHRHSTRRHTQTHTQFERYTRTLTHRDSHMFMPYMLECFRDVLSECTDGRFAFMSCKTRSSFPLYKSNLKMDEMQKIKKNEYKYKNTLKHTVKAF